ERVARRIAALRTKIDAQRTALFAAGNAAAPANSPDAAAAVAAVDAALADHRRALETALADRRAQRSGEELALLLDGDGEHPGLDELLADRRIADARARVAQAAALAEEDRNRWSAVVASLE